MEMLNVGTARSIWLFDVRELNPKGKKLSPGLIEWLKNRYEFEKVPASAIDLDDTKALSFSRGSFNTQKGDFIGIELKVYEDGIVANAISSTRDTDEFIEKTLQSFVAEYGLAFTPEMIRNKLYLSEVYFRSKKQLNGINNKISEFSAKISALLPGDPKASFDFSAMHFLPRPTIPNYQLAEFRIERKANTLPEEKIFYSRAPLHTDDHLKLLEEFEAVFMA